MKRYKQILLYVVSTMLSIYNWCDRWHVKCIIKKLIVSVQSFWYAPCKNAPNDPLTSVDELYSVGNKCHQAVLHSDMNLEIRFRTLTVITIKGVSALIS